MLHTLTRPLRFFLLLFVAGSLLIGCADDFAGFDDATTETVSRPAFDQDDKFRHAHLLDRALKPKAGKTLSSDDLYLLVGLDPATSPVEKQRLYERYKLHERYRITERFEYKKTINGWAWQISDTLGLSEYQQFLAELAADPEIAWFEPDFDVSTPDSDAMDGSAGQEVPWSVAAVGGTESWAASGDGSGDVDVDVYILDTGVARADNNDPDDDLALIENLDFRAGYADPKDYDGHGTHIAGIAAAVDDSDGLVGLAPGARVHNLKVLNDDGKTDVSVIIAAVEYVTEQKLAHPQTPMVVNLSLGEDIGTAAYTALDEAIRASTAAGVLYVVAAGNYGESATHVTPAHVTEAITVGSYGMAGEFSDFSNYGSKVDILAPGEDVVSLAPGSAAPVKMSGTSMSAAHVTGAAALYLAQHPQASPAAVEQALLEAARTDVVFGAPGGTTQRSLWVGPAGTSAPTGSASAEARVASSNDDAEEESDGDMDLSSSDLELAYEGSSAQTIGMRFAGLDVPQGATITRAYVQFTVDETDSGPVALVIHGQDSDDANSFSTSDGDISGRPRTAASVEWAPPAWDSVGEAGADQRTPDLTGIVQDIVARSGWNAGNALTLFVSGTGERTAESHNGSSGAAPLLRVEWVPGTEGHNVRSASDAPDAAPDAAPSMVDIRVSSGNDDAEEEDDGDMDLSSSDLELAYEGSSAQTIGMRFSDTGIPQGATITRAYVQFTVDETDSGPAALVIHGQDSDDANSFSSSNGNISGRPRTAASVEWAPSAWDSVGEAGADQRTPDLSAVIQEIVNRPGWFGDDLVLIISGTGERTAESHNGNASAAPLLHIEWQ